MPDFESLNNQFLIAMPALNDPNFSRTVTLICEHTPDGALGVTINRQLDLSIENIFEQLDIKTTHSDLPIAHVYQGGPVQENRGFVLHKPIGNWESTLTIADDLGLSTSQDILQAMASGKGPAQCLLALGYAGWGPGQLEYEIRENTWLSGPADHKIIFETKLDKRWLAAAESMGVDLNSIHGEAGHA
jgi:putative transcriptional regulator